MELIRELLCVFDTFSVGFVKRSFKAAAHNLTAQGVLHSYL